jgi:tryptophan aminotransferase
MNVSGLSQAIIYSILQSWGPEGLQIQLEAVQQEYTKRRDALHEYAKKYIGEYADWYLPSAGKPL